jgi:hypothetical protein
MAVSDQQWDGSIERRSSERTDHGHDIDVLFGMIRNLHRRIDELPLNDLDPVIALAEMRGDLKRVVSDIEEIKTAAVALSKSLLDLKVLRWKATGGIQTIAVTSLVVGSIAGAITWVIATYSALHSVVH